MKSKEAIETRDFERIIAFGGKDKLTKGIWMIICSVLTIPQRSERDPERAIYTPIEAAAKYEEPFSIAELKADRFVIDHAMFI